MALLTDRIWEKKGVGTMSQTAYIRSIASFTLIAACLTTLGALTSYQWSPSWLLILGSFVGSMVCIFLFQGSDNPLLSFLGVSGMSFLMGLMIGPVTAMYHIANVVQAVVLTAGAMGLMSLAGIMVPAVFRGWGPYLMAGLTLLIIVQFSQLIFLALGFEQAARMTWITWAGVLVFLGLTAYDWARALSLPYTLDNAIDVSGGLILDAINLFLRFLQLGKGKK